MCGEGSGEEWSRKCVERAVWREVWSGVCGERSGVRSVWRGVCGERTSWREDFVERGVCGVECVDRGVERGD